MTEIQSSSMRAVIMDLIKTKFGAYTLWDRIEADIAVKCANLPEIIDDTKRIKFIKGLLDLKNYLIDQRIEPSDLKFLDEEIERFENTKQISLYEEKDDYIDNEIVKKYSNIGFGTEGVVGVHLALNYEQLRRLTNGVYKRTGLIKFYISREITVYGKVTAEIYEHPQKIPIATLVCSKKISKETNEPVSKFISLFGERYDKTKHTKIKEIESPFYVYRFITEHNQDLVILCSEPCELGDYIITGVVTQCDDYKMLTDSAKLPTKLPFMFVHSFRNKIIKYNNHDEFRKRLFYLKINKNNTFNFPFTAKNKGQLFLLSYPSWYKWLIWAWLTHSSVGKFDKYPLHLLIVGDPHSGKSLLLESLHSKTKESKKVFSGAGSTLKKLVPSFRYKPAQNGYLAESNRFGFCDEFLRCLVSAKTTEDKGREESVAIMNDLLEHKKREVGSGVSSTNVNMTARVIAATNPVRGTRTIENILSRLDESFLTRWLIMFQTKEQVKMVRRSRDTDLKPFPYTMSDNDWVSILDYLHSFNSRFNSAMVEEIYNSVKGAMSEVQSDHYESRHKHHISCVMDGIIKTRCLFERDMSFGATKEDYEMLRKVWGKVIGTWLDGENINKMDIKNRIYYLPESSQIVYWKLVELGGTVNREQFEVQIKEVMAERSYNTAVVVLRECGLVRFDWGQLIVYYK